MKNSARTPRRAAATATACAWLPALAAQTPAFSTASGRRSIAFVAPRTLNEPVRCRHSALSITSPPNRRESSPERRIGVRMTCGATVRAASSMPAAVTAPLPVVATPMRQR